MIAPVIFLLMIAEIAKGVSSPTRVLSFVDDTRVKRAIKEEALQADLNLIYLWAQDVGLEFNSKKFECLRYRTDSRTLAKVYLSPFET